MDQAREGHVERHPHGGEWLRDVVFGLNDGLVTTLVFIMAVNAIASTRLVLIALGEIVAGGISMALGAFLSAQTTQDIIDRRIATERHEIVYEPEEERAELRSIYENKGLKGPLLERVVDHLTSDHERWLQSLVRDELGVVEEERDRPWLQGGIVGISFMVGGMVPVVPYVVLLPQPQVAAYVLTAIVAFVLGAVKARYTLKGPLRSGLEFLVIVTIGTIVGAVAGRVLHAV